MSLRKSIKLWQEKQALNSLLKHKLIHFPYVGNIASKNLTVFMYIKLFLKWPVQSIQLSKNNKAAIEFISHIPDGILDVLHNILNLH